MTFAALIAGCSSPKYEADRAAGLGDAEAATLEVDPDIRLLSLDGEAIGELPVVGVRDLRRDKGTHRRRVRLRPGEHTVVAGLGPSFGRTYGRQTGGGVGASAGVGGGVSVGGGFSGGRTSATFRHPGSAVDERAAFALEPGRAYILDFVEDEDPAGPGWRLRVAPKNSPRGTLNVARTLGRQDSPHEGRPFREGA